MGNTCSVSEAELLRREFRIIHESKYPPPQGMLLLTRTYSTENDLFVGVKANSQPLNYNSKYVLPTYSHIDENVGSTQSRLFTIYYWYEKSLKNICDQRSQENRYFSKQQFDYLMKSIVKGYYEILRNQLRNNTYNNPYCQLCISMDNIRIKEKSQNEQSSFDSFIKINTKLKVKIAPPHLSNYKSPQHPNYTSINDKQTSILGLIFLHTALLKNVSDIYKGGYFNKLMLDNYLCQLSIRYPEKKALIEKMIYGEEWIEIMNDLNKKVSGIGVTEIERPSWRNTIPRSSDLQFSRTYYNINSNGNQQKFHNTLHPVDKNNSFTYSKPIASRSKSPTFQQISAQERNRAPSIKIITHSPNSGQQQLIKSRSQSRIIFVPATKITNPNFRQQRVVSHPIPYNPQVKTLYQTPKNLSPAKQQMFIRSSPIKTQNVPTYIQSPRNNIKKAGKIYTPKISRINQAQNAYKNSLKDQYPPSDSYVDMIFNNLENKSSPVSKRQHGKITHSEYYINNNTQSKTIIDLLFLPSTKDSPLAGMSKQIIQKYVIKTKEDHETFPPIELQTISKIKQSKHQFCQSMDRQSRKKIIYISNSDSFCESCRCCSHSYYGSSQKSDTSQKDRRHQSKKRKSKLKSKSRKRSRQRSKSRSWSRSSQGLEPFSVKRNSLQKKQVVEVKNKVYWMEGKKYFYQGKLEQQKPHGKGILYYQKNKKAYQGNFKKGKLDGKGIQYRYRYESVPTIKSDFNDRKFQNAYEHWTRYQGQFKHGLRDGQGTLFLQNGEIIQGSFKQGKLHGQCTMIGKRIIVKSKWNKNYLQKYKVEDKNIDSE